MGLIEMHVCIIFGLQLCRRLFQILRDPEAPAAGEHEEHAAKDQGQGGAYRTGDGDGAVGGRHGAATGAARSSWGGAGHGVWVA
jgi:hypothetical protein